MSAVGLRHAGYCHLRRCFIDNLWCTQRKPTHVCAVRNNERVYSDFVRGPKQDSAGSGDYNASDRQQYTQRRGRDANRNGAEFGRRADRPRYDSRQRFDSRQRYDSRRNDRGDRGQYFENQGDDYDGASTSHLAILKQNWIGDVLYGVAPITAALRAERRKVHALYIQDSMDMSKRKDAAAVKRAIARAKELEAPIHYIGKHELNLICDNKPHQGLVLDCSALEWEDMEEFPEAASLESATSAAPVWLVLDQVVDPQNLGAVVRSAHLLGAAGVLACAKNCAPLSAVTSKASAGALEVTTMYTCKNLPRTLAAASESGWMVVGASADAGSVSCHDFVVERPTILVMGNEGYGLRTNVKRCCAAMLRIDMAQHAADLGLVDSFNVSVATGILLHHLITDSRRRYSSP